MATSLPSAALTKVSSDANSLATRIDALLPQTQCTRCGFVACRPYADALAEGTTDINRCPPGGTDLIAALAALTGRAPKPLASECGTQGPLRVAVIDEAACIGCTLCIQACPVDAIIGAQKRMHAVLPSLCSGCELCVPPCPVDCIALPPAARPWTTADADAARARAGERAARLARGERVARRAIARPHPAQASPEGGAHDRARRQAAVAAALARARARRATETKGSS